MRDRYNLNLLPGMSEDGVEYGEAPSRSPNPDPWCDSVGAEALQDKGPFYGG